MALQDPPVALPIKRVSTHPRDGQGDEDMTANIAEVLARNGLEAADAKTTRDLIEGGFPLMPRTRRVLETVARLLNHESTGGGK